MPNPECKDFNCLTRQDEHKKAGKDFKKARAELIASQKSVDKSSKNVDSEKINQEALDWGIELIEEDEEVKVEEEIKQEIIKKETIENTDVDDLAAQLKAMM